MRNGHIWFLEFIYAYTVAYLCFQGDPTGVDEKDSIQEELKEE